MAELGTVYVDVNGDFNKFGKTAESSFGSIAKKAAGIFAAAFVGKQIFDFAGASVEEAVNLSESVNAVNQSFEGANVDAVHALGEASAESMGLATSEFNSFAVRFAGFANQIAGPGGDTAAVIEDVGTRVADFASVMNLDANEAATEFSSIMAGSSEVARKYGIDVSAVAVEQFALESGLAASKEEMTEAVKVQARYGLLMQETDQWAGDFAATSDQLANAQRIASAEFSNAKAELGSALLPVLAEVVGMLRDQVIPLVGILQPVFVLLAEAIAQIMPPVVELIGRLAPLVAKILPPLTKILMLVIDLFLELLDPILTVVETALDPLLAIVELLVGEFAESMLPVVEAVGEIILALVPILDLLIPLIKIAAQVVGFLAKMLSSSLAEGLHQVAVIISTVIGAIKTAITWITNLGTKLGTSFGPMLRKVLDWFKELPGKILAFIGNAGKWLMDTGKDIIRGFIDGIKSMAGKIVKAIKDFVLDKIPGPIKSFFGIGSPSKLMMSYGRDISQGLIIGIREGARGVGPAMDRLMQVPSFAGSANFGVGGVGGAGALGTQLVFNGPVGGDMGLFAQQIAEAQAREARYQLG